MKKLLLAPAVNVKKYCKWVAFGRAKMSNSKGLGSSVRRILFVCMLQFWLIAPVQAQWESLPNIPFERPDHVAASGTIIDVNGNQQSRIFVFGGFRNPSTAANQVDAYDPVTNEWEVNPPYPDLPVTGGLFRPSVATDSDGKIYIIGGSSSLTGPTKSVHVFDPGGISGDAPNLSLIHI